jgi:hypothetical protein
MSLSREFDHEIEKGAKLLAARVPGWEKKINPETLDLSDSCKCVLGQVYGNYEDGFKALDLPFLTDRAIRGFTVDRTEHSSYRPLTKGWLRFLEARAAAPFKAAAKRIK